MQIVYCRLETTDNKIRDFNIDKHAKLSHDDYYLIFRAYLYLIYYFSIINEMTEEDIDFYKISSPPFIKAVFILKYENRFLKLNYSESPFMYQLSDFDPETRESKIISSQSREIYYKMIDEFGLKAWEEYKYLCHFIVPDKSKEEKKLEVSSYGDEYSSDYEEDSLVLAKSSVTYEELEPQTFTSKNFDKYSIKDRRKLLSEYKEKLRIALEVNELKQKISETDKKINYYASVERKINKLNEEIKNKENEREKFRDISWMSLNLYKQMNLYKIKKKKYEESLIAYNEKLKKNKKDLQNIDHDNIFKNKIFLPSFLTAIITFILSWVMREQFWYLSIPSIVFFTVSFYYLWGYLDYIEYIIKLKREKNFYEKKIIKTERDFKKEFGNLEAILKQEKADDIDVPLSRFDELKEYELELEKLKEDLQTYIAQKFSDDTQIKYENLKNEKKFLLDKLAEIDDKDLNYKELEFDIVELKKSIKEYEKQELDEFTLDDEPVSKDDKKEYTNKYELKELKDYLSLLKDILRVDLSQLYKNIENDFRDIFEFSVNYGFNFEFDFEDFNFFLVTENEIKWNEKFDKRIKIFFQYALIKYLSLKEPLIIFLDLPKLSIDYGVMLAAYLPELSEAQVIYTE